MLENNYVMLLIVVAVGGLAYFFFNKPKTEAEKTKSSDKDAVSLQLQAYERLTLLTDRIAIPNLVGRTSYEGLSAREMQLVLTRTIRDEFEYNITQQIYVTAEAWKAVKNLKEKNLLIINQVAAALPTAATGLDLNKSLLEYLMRDDKADLHELVSQALSFEAKKLL
jgi:uncharacterized protein (UPF0333 family)